MAPMRAIVSAASFLDQLPGLESPGEGSRLPCLHRRKVARALRLGFGAQWRDCAGGERKFRGHIGPISGMRRLAIPRAGRPVIRLVTACLRRGRLHARHDAARKFSPRGTTDSRCPSERRKRRARAPPRRPPPRPRPPAPNPSRRPPASARRETRSLQIDETTIRPHIQTIFGDRIPSAVNLKFLSFAASSCRNFKFKNRTRIIKLLVPLLIPKFASEVPRVLANFGIGALVIHSAAICHRSGLHCCHACDTMIWHERCGGGWDGASHFCLPNDRTDGRQRGRDRDRHPSAHPAAQGARPVPCLRCMP
jgi:hypothetical protein